MDVAHGGVVSQLRGPTRSETFISVTIDGLRKRFIALAEAGRVLIAVDGQCLVLSEPALLDPQTKPSDPSQVLAPLAGRVARILVEASSALEPDQTVCVVEAMKMETRVVAAASGKVRELHVKAGDQVSAGQLLVSIDLTKEPRS
jgi:biotin carboxyl carrier protein